MEIAAELLGQTLGLGVSLDANGGFCPCPGMGRHTKGNGPKDFRVVLDGAPTGYCFHGSCSDEVAAFNKELRRRIWLEENGREARAPQGHWGEAVAAVPKGTEKKARPELDREKIAAWVRGCPEVNEGWMRRRSAVDVGTVDARGFIDALYREGERVLIFTDQRSQGDFIAWKKPAELSGPAEVGTYRLAQQRGVKAVASRLPTGGPEGMWFLVQPVTGQWEVKQDVTMTTGTREVAAKYTRRSQGNVQAWRYFVLESDELSAGEWLRVLAHVALPIAAIYTSGGRSIHALVKMEVASKAEWDAVKKTLVEMMCPMGADPAALTAVRLSRLPGCLRGNRMQELLYLNPEPDHRALRLLPELRG